MKSSPRRVRPISVALLAASATVLAACSTAPAAPDSDGLEVLASFYPLQYVAEQVGGDAVTVTSVTPAGGEPHDVELSPRQVRAVGEADVVVVLSGFQPAVDEAVAARAPALLVDAAETPEVAAHMDAEDDDDHAEESADEDHEAEEEHDHGADPHFWLDPTLLAAVGHDLADVLGDAAPESADSFTANAESFAAEMADLDRAFGDGLADCERTTVVAAHEAYGFLAERYGLEQVGISGLDPEAEPSPARLREIREVVEDLDVTTIFTEELVNPKVAETLAGDLGIDTAVLDPVESQVDPDTDYRGAMQQNLEALREALACR